MTDLLAARSQMAVSLGFHILFAVAGVAMPLLMIAAEGLWLRTGDPAALALAKRWSKGTAVIFAVGAVSGTVLSFELGLLWPAFMREAGPIIGMPFSLEGLAFFLEAIFLGIYLYGWKRVPPLAHWACGLMVLLSGVASAVFVTTANAWMNTPAGFRVENGVPVDIRPFAAMLNPAALPECLHMTLAAFVSIGAAASGLHAWRLLHDRKDRLHRLGLAISLSVLGVSALLQPVSGDLSARHVARHQPVKLAAAEGHWKTQRGAPLRLGGWVDDEAETTRFSLEIPRGLSLLAFHDADAEVLGLSDVPKSERPPAAVVHAAFEIMVGCGSLLAALSVLAGFLAWRQAGLPDQKWFLRLVVLAGPLGFVALEAGWVVTEVGRQPWIVRGFMRTADAVTPMPGLVVPFTLVTLLYVVLSVTVVALLRRQVLSAAHD